MNRLLYIALGLLLILAAVYAAPNDGVCDSSDVLTKSTDCSAAVYLLTLKNAPVSSIYLTRTSSQSGILTFEVVNYDSSKPGVLCLSGSNITLFTDEGNKESVCAVVPPSSYTILSVGVRYSSVPSDGHVGDLVVSTVNNSRTVPVYVLEKPNTLMESLRNYAVPISLIVFSLVVLLVSRFYA